MTSDISFWQEDRAGRIMLTRAHALNAVTYEMVLAIEAALIAWRDDPAIELVVITAEGEKAFSAGGDLLEMYRTGRAGDYSYGRRFWSDEYRLNAIIAEYPKPYVALCQGFTMGGGVGISCHGSHRIVGETSRIAMPECAVGLIPDVGGSYLLSRAPGHLGEYLGLTGFRMDAGDAIYAGFADSFVPEADWPDLTKALCDKGITALTPAAAPASGLKARQEEIDALWSGDNLSRIAAACSDKDRAALGRASPIAAAAAFETIRAVRTLPGIRAALRSEFRFVYRAMEHGDFIEGIRAIIVDKDNAPSWRYPAIGDVPGSAVSAILAPLGADELTIA